MDELVEYLCRKGGGRVTAGKDGCSLLLLGDSSAGETGLKALLLTAGLPGSFSDDVKQAAADLCAVWDGDGDFTRLAGAGRALADRSGLPLLLAGYETDPGVLPSGRLSMTFLAKPVLPPGEMLLCRDGAFAGWLYHAMGSNFWDAGTVKPKNRRLADAFHAWSRENLSAFLVKQDFDAIYLEGARCAMVEVKRSSVGGVARWRPYRADARNYDIQSRFARMLGAPFYTFHHTGGSCDKNTLVGCYEVLDVDPQAAPGEQWIRYQRTVRRAGELIELLETGR